MEEELNQKDRIRGSLIGGAIGDALGYPIEFMNSFQQIQNNYGKDGITQLDTNTPENKAVISDDTQMTLFTAYGILKAKQMGSAPIPCITEAYIGWLFTQLYPNQSWRKRCALQEIAALNILRAPGNTCIEALSDIFENHIPKNNSKGCGGVMRIAPIPLYGMAQNRITDIKVLDTLAADTAKITHLHPLGYIPAAFVSDIIYKLATDAVPCKTNLEVYIQEALKTINELYPKQAEETRYFKELIGKAVYLASSLDDINDVDIIEKNLGGGWVAEETVAIATYCSLKYFGNFEKAMIAAVNHAGDSDSTGAVTGNILGAAIGYNNIPQHFRNDLELHDLIIRVADDLWMGEMSLV